MGLCYSLNVNIFAKLIITLKISLILIYNNFNVIKLHTIKFCNKFASYSSSLVINC